MKNTINKFLNKAAIAAGSVLLFSVAAFAQVNPSTFPTEGNAVISSTVSPSVQLSTYSTATITGAMPGSGASSSNAATGNAINTVLNFGEVSTNNTTADDYVYGQMGMQVRSNTGYIIRATRTGTLNDAVGNTGTLSTGDVGVGVFNVQAGGSTLSYPNAGAGTINGTTALGFYRGQTVAQAITPQSVVNGSQPVWFKTLRDINSTATPIIEGTRVSNGGDNSNYQNRLTLQLAFAIKPQYYTVSTNAQNTVNLFFDIIPAP